MHCRKDGAVTRSTSVKRLSAAVVSVVLMSAAWWLTRPATDGDPEAADTASAPVQLAAGIASPRPKFVDVTKQFGLAGLTQQDRSAVDAGRLGPPDLMTGGVAVVDVNGDGWEDLFFPRVRQSDVWMLNQAGAGFKAAPAGMLPGSASESHGTSAWGDLDGDGDIDGVVGGIGDGSTVLYLQRDDGTMAEVVDSGLVLPPNADVGDQLVFGLTLTDLDADGDLDLVASGWRYNRVAADGQTAVFVNDGAAKFTEMPTAIPEVGRLAAFTTAAGDVDGDGILDLAGAAAWNLSRLLTGQGDGTFVDATKTSGVGTDENGMGSVLADIDGDDDLDWFVTSVSAPGCKGPLDPTAGGEVKGCTGNRLFINDGAGRFTDGTDAYGVRDGEWGWGAAMEDLDNDGDLDLLHTNGFRPAKPPPGQERYVTDTNRVFFNDGKGPWVEDAAAVGLGGAGDGRAMVTVDVDRDGDLDVLEVDNLDGPQLYRNELPIGDDWAEVQLVDAQGAPVVEATVWLDDGRLRDAGVSRRRDLRAADSYAAQRSAVAHFGLPTGAPDKLTVLAQRPGDRAPKKVGVVERGGSAEFVLSE